MSITLTYEPTFSGVEIDINSLGTAPFALVERSTNQISWTTVRGGAAVEVGPVPLPELTDTFTRTEVDSWGNADTGQAWTLSGGVVPDNYDVNSGVGKQSNSTVAALRHSKISLGVTEAETLVDVTVPVVPTGAAITAWVAGRGDFTANSYYAAQLNIATSGDVTLVLAKRVAGVLTTLLTSASIGTHSAGDTWRIRFRYFGTQLKARAWKTTDAEPGTWQAETADSALTAGTDIGLLSRLETGNTNTLPVVMSWDNLSAYVWGARLTDYEFTPGVVNYYRVRGFGQPQFISVGAADHDVNAAVTPGIPPGTLGGDTMVLLAACRNSGTGTVDTTAGWAADDTQGNMKLMSKTAAGTVGAPTTDVSPTVTFTGTAAGVDTSAQIVTFRGVDTSTFAEQGGMLNGAAANIAFGSLTPPDVNNLLALLFGWKQDDFTLATPPSPWTKIAQFATTTGDDQGLVWAYQSEVDLDDIAAGDITCTGGGSAISRSNVVVYGSDEYINEQTSTITPEINSVWLKSLARPFLNRPIQALLDNPTRIVRPARTGVFNIKGRTLPVAVNDIRGSRRFTIKALTETSADGQTMDFVLAAGDVMLIHVPHGCTSPPSGYVTILDAEQSYHPLRPERKTWTLPCIEVAPPGPHVVGALATWDSVLAQFASWDDVLAAFSSWQELLDTLIGDPSEVIVP